MLIKIKISDEIFNKLQEGIKNKTCEWNSNLAGNLKEEYLINDCIPLLDSYLLDNISKSKELMPHLHNGGYKFNTENKKLKLESLWVNYQKKHEFNPMHNHSGIFSFIIFMQIPYYSKLQKQISPGKKSNVNLAGQLEFITFNSVGDIQIIDFDVDKTWEQDCLIFPSKLYHCVYPFYGVDEYRITVSGNYLFQV